ncbi:hypothetical protein B5P44_22075 [Mycobacterium sp. CBMA 213]|nr:hypothetical protein [Mycolicibacterium sp. CBMA 213]
MLSLIRTNLAQLERLIKHVFEIVHVGVSAVDLAVRCLENWARSRQTLLVGGSSYGSQQFDHMFYRSNVWAI